MRNPTLDIPEGTKKSIRFAVFSKYFRWARQEMRSKCYGLPQRNANPRSIVNRYLCIEFAFCIRIPKGNPNCTQKGIEMRGDDDVCISLETTMHGTVEKPIITVDGHSGITEAAH